jgi:hypothetical protein
MCADSANRFASLLTEHKGFPDGFDMWLAWAVNSVVAGGR